MDPDFCDKLDLARFNLSNAAATTLYKAAKAVGCDKGLDSMSHYYEVKLELSRPQDQRHRNAWPLQQPNDPTNRGLRKVDKLEEKADEFLREFLTTGGQILSI